MKKNNLLNFCILLCKGFCVLQVAAFVALTVAFIHFQVNPDYYDFKPAKFSSGDAMFSYSFTEKWSAQPSPDNSELSLNQITVFSLYLNYLQFSLMILFTFLSVREFVKVVTSVTRIETFRISNIYSFRKIGKYLLIVFILSGFSVIHFKEATFRSYSLHLMPLMLMIFSYIMAEIFREGNNLSEENQLTI